MSRALEEYTAQFWKKKVVPGKSVVCITDSQAIEDSLRDEGNTAGTEHVVKSMQRFQFAASELEYLLFDLGEEDGDHLFLLVKIVGEEFDLRVLFADPSFTPGNRHDMLHNDALWMFDEPKDMDAFEQNPEGNMNTCAYVKAYGREEDGKSFDAEMKQQGELYCRNSNGEMTTIVEYLANTETSNPESMFIEEGDSGCDPDVEDNGMGGWMQHFVGCNITPEEIEVW